MSVRLNIQLSFISTEITSNTSCTYSICHGNISSHILSCNYPIIKTCIRGRGVLECELYTHYNTNFENILYQFHKSMKTRLEQFRSNNINFHICPYMYKYKKKKKTSYQIKTKYKFNKYLQYTIPIKGSSNIKPTFSQITSLNKFSNIN